MAQFPFYRQPDQMDCGPTCLRMIAKHYGRSVSLEKLRKLSETTREGSSLKTISDASEKLGFRSLGVKISLNKLVEEAPMPCILHWNQNHFVVVYKIKNGNYYISDPGHGLITLNEKEFLGAWIGAKATVDTEEGVALLLEPSPRLNITEDDDTQEKKGFGFLYQYLFRYKKFLVQLVIGLIAGSLLNLIFPFLTQSVVDVGIQNQDIHFVYLILIAQLFIFAGRVGIELIRGWILLHLSTRINISLISDFFIKLMNLPIAYFDSKMTGDIMQRINDHQRIERLLTSTSLNVLFSTFNLVIFGAVLAYYNLQIFMVFIAGSVLYFLWVVIFLKRRKVLDYKRFDQMSNEQSKVMELINGMQEIKLHNAEKEKRWSWEYLQARLFKIETQNLTLQQTQSTGANVINELKNIFVTILSAKLVIEGDLTLGQMIAVTYILGQLNGPIQQLIGFVYTVQDAKIALERLSEIHNKEDEEKIGEEKVVDVPLDAPIKLNQISFRYTGAIDEVIKDLSLEIPANKITAIVGASGSGKTTLMKILLKFYEVSKGDIKVGPADINSISQHYW